jgi:hypothetical protein
MKYFTKQLDAVQRKRQEGCTTLEQITWEIESELYHQQISLQLRLDFEQSSQCLV